MTKKFDQFLNEDVVLQGDPFVIALAEEIMKRQHGRVIRSYMRRSRDEKEDDESDTSVVIEIFEVEFNNQHITKTANLQQAQAIKDSFIKNSYLYLLHHKRRDILAKRIETDSIKDPDDARELEDLSIKIKPSEDSWTMWELKPLAEYYKIDMNKLREKYRGYKLGRELDVV